MFYCSLGLLLPVLLGVCVLAGTTTARDLLSSLLGKSGAQTVNLYLVGTGFTVVTEFFVE